MSNKSRFTPRQPKLKPTPPRPLSEIQNSYSQLAYKAGEIQYQIHIWQLELDKLNEAMISVNNEAAARQQLDSKAKEPEVPMSTQSLEGVPNEQQN